MSDNEYDVVIVGGGSAGAVLATRLSANPGRRVLLLEAGPAYPANGYPAAVTDSSRLGAYTGHDWGYTTEPGVIGHPVAAYRGKILGGSSAMNGSVAMRALPADFDRWAKAGLTGWSFDEVLPDYVALENTTVGGAWHGTTGPLPIHQLTMDEVSPAQRAFIDAARATGIPATDDFNGPSPEGVAPYPMNVVNRTRVNTGMAYLTDAVRGRANLDIRPGAMVDRVLFDGTRATGVLLAGGETVPAGEVVLAAGAYGSPAVLLRSGVGPARDLRTLDIPVIADLPVGARLQDHPFSYNVYAAHPERLGEQAPVIGAMLWTASSQAAAGELDLHIAGTHLFDPAQSPTGAGYVLAVALVQPESTGSLTITSTDPQAAPRIDLNLLAGTADRGRLLEGVRLARRIAATAPLAAMLDHELAPGAAATTDSAIEQAVLAGLDTYHHPTSTAPMGAADDPSTVVDWLGAVRDVQGLRVVDASILPDAPSAAIHLTVLAAAEHIARLAYPR